MRALTYGLTAILVALFVLTWVAMAISRIDLSRAEGNLRSRWLPAQNASFLLETTYVDQETVQRGYLLTRETRFLQAFTQYQATSTSLETQLRSMVKGDPRALADLRRVEEAHSAWLALATEQVATQTEGPLTAAELASMAEASGTRFKAVRNDLTTLTGRTNVLAADELDRIAGENGTENLITAVAVVIALLVAALAVPALRRVLTRPLHNLLARVQNVAGGDYDSSIPAEGPVELAALARAVDQMRESILGSMRELVEARHRLILRDERVRIAADLHDLSVQRLFALGLSLSAVANRDRTAAKPLLPLIDETDRIIRELRGIIFDLSHYDVTNMRANVDEFVHDSSRALGYTPVVSMHGPIDQIGRDTAEALLAVLHEALSNVARHAHATRAEVTVAVTAETVSLTVTDDGDGLDPLRPPGGGTRNMETRAQQLGGTVSVENRAGAGTTLIWQVPRASATSAAGGPTRTADVGIIT